MGDGSAVEKNRLQSCWAWCGFGNLAAFRYADFQRSYTVAQWQVDPVIALAGWDVGGQCLGVFGVFGGPADA